LAPNDDPSRFTIYLKRPLSIDRLSETHQNAFVVSEIIGMLRKSFISQIFQGGTHDSPIVAETLHAQRTVRQLAIPDSKILSLPHKINVTIRQTEIDGHFRMLSQERI
jgi:hypothetical protein